MPLDRSSVPVELDQVLSMFDAQTREAAAKNLVGFGDAFAGRGPALGRTIEELSPLFGHLHAGDEQPGRPGDRHCAASSASSATTTAVIAPISKHATPQLFTSMADTFEAIARDPEALKQTIAKAPPTMDVGIDSFRVQRPFLDRPDGVLDRPRGRHERAARGAADGQPRDRGRARRCSERAVALNDAPAGRDATRSRTSTTAPGTNVALRGLTATVTTLNPQLRYFGPYVTVCNCWNYFWTNVAEHFSEQDITGPAQRALLNFAGQQDNSLGAMGAERPANGEGVKNGTPQYLQGQTYGAAVDRGRPRRLRGRPARLPRATGARRPTRSTWSRATRARPAPRARRTPAARACPRARRSRAIPRRARTRRCHALGAGGPLMRRASAHRA